MTIAARPELDRVLAPRLSALARVLRPRAGEASWIRPATIGVVLLAAIVYVVNLTVSGYANTFYSGAAVAASQSWSAWFFGSIDAANFITVDKPPLATMLMGLSVRLFGLSSWSILLPEALAGVATVAILMATIRRTFGSTAAVVGGLAAALTPAAVLMFRYNNPDALLTLLLVAAAYALVRAIESGSHRWVAAAAAFVGLAFLTKSLQAYLVLPAFGIAYAFAAAGTARHRITGLAIAFATVVLSSGWWVAIVELIPASARPYIGGSETNSVLELIFGYNGLGRIFGQGGGGAGASFSGTPGILRLFNDQFGGQVAWLLPLALVSIGIGVWARRRAARTDAARAGYLLWGIWLITHVIVFSFMSGIVHSYYAVAMAPAIGALAGGGVVELWRMRGRVAWGGAGLAVAIAGSAVLAWRILDRTPAFAPGLGATILILGLAAAAVVALPLAARLSRVGGTAAAIGVAVLLLAPAAYAIDTMQTAYFGGIVTAGPSVGGGGGPGAFGGGAGPADGRMPGGGGTPPGGTLPAQPPDAGAAVDGPRGNPGGTNPGAIPGNGEVSADLTQFLVANRGDATWIVAVTGATTAGSIEVQTGLPVMAMGGFNGDDPAPTLEQLQAYVASGELRYILIGGQGDRGGMSSAVTTWVTTNGTVVSDVGGGSLYDLGGASG